MDSNQDRVGVCLSGGGIRAAAFSLGALQALQARLGLLKGDRHATYLSAVSGGSYTAAAYVLAAGGALETPSQWADPEHPPEDPSPDGHPWSSPGDTSLHRPIFKSKEQVLKDVSKNNEALRRNGWKTHSPANPFMPGTDEANFIRQHARYLVEPSPLANGTTFLMLAVTNMVLILSVLAVAGFACGWTIRTLHGPAPQEPSAWPFLIASFILVVIAYSTFMAAIYGGERRREYAEYVSEADMRHDTVMYLCSLSSVAIAFGFWAPYWLRDALDDNLGAAGWKGTAALGAALLTTLAAAAPGIAVLGKVIGDPVPKALLSRLSRIGRFFQVLGFRLAQVVISLIIPALLIFTFYAAWAAALAPRLNLIAIVFAAYVAILVNLSAVLTGGAQSFTPFAFYRDRIASCFDVLRQYRDEDESTDPPRSAATRARQRLVTPKLSKLKEQTDVPELLICASVNISERGVTAAGSQARQVVFSPHTVEIAGVPDAKIPTDKLEALLHRRRNVRGFNASVLSCVAVTGAAVSPTMGKFTRAWLRALMCFMNLRLGAWIPNPASERVRSAIATGGRDRRLLPILGYGLLLRELRGKHYLQSRLIYASDGGHYENLGLVELVRRECTEVWCIDASGDRPGSALTLAQSLTVLTSEHGCDVDFDLSAFALAEPTGEPAPLVGAVYQSGIITRPLSPVARQGEGMPRRCVLHVVKIGMDTSSSHRFREMRNRYPKFPYDSTLNQLYNAERFDQYRDLGYESTERAIDASLAECGSELR